MDNLSLKMNIQLFILKLLNENSGCFNFYVLEFVYRSQGPQLYSIKELFTLIFNKKEHLEINCKLAKKLWQHDLHVINIDILAKT